MGVNALNMLPRGCAVFWGSQCGLFSDRRSQGFLLTQSSAPIRTLRTTSVLTTMFAKKISPKERISDPLALAADETAMAALRDVFRCCSDGITLLSLRFPI